MEGGYPQQPGWRASATGETSRDAALAIRAKGTPMLRQLIDLLRDGPASPEQLHRMLAEQGRPALLTSVRARVCQLNKLGRVVDTGQRGLGESGRSKVIVWRLLPETEWPASPKPIESGGDAE